MKIIIIFLIFSIFAIPSFAQNRVEVKTAGTLFSLISNNLKSITNLTITGELNNIDITILKKMGTLETLTNLNLSEVIIKDESGNITNKIPNEAFRGASKLEKIILPQSAISIGEYFAAECDLLKSIVLPENLEYTFELTFAGCNNINNITISDKSKYFKTEDNVLFTKDGSELILYLSTKKNEEYAIPPGVKNIRTGSIESCSYIKTLLFPETLETVEGWTCRYLPNLKKLELPKSLQKIGPYAFSKNGDAEIFLKSNIPPILDRDAFWESKEVSKVFVPKGSYYNYWLDDLWSAFKNIEEYDYTDKEEDVGNEVMHKNGSELKTRITSNGILISSSGNKNIQIFTINGCLVKQLKLSSEQFILLSPGNYVITNGTDSEKIIVYK